MKPSEVESADYVISPLTGEKIPANKIQEHMRIGEFVTQEHVHVKNQ